MKLSGSNKSENYYTIYSITFFIKSSSDTRDNAILIL